MSNRSTIRPWIILLVAALSRSDVVFIEAKPSSSSRRRRIEYHLPNDISKTKKKKTYQHRVIGAISYFFRQSLLGGGGTTTTVNDFVTNDKSIIDIHNERRVGAWCPPLPPNDDDAIDDESLITHETTTKEKSTIETDNLAIDAASDIVELAHDKSLVACTPSDLVVSTVVLDNSNTNTNNNNNNCLAAVETTKTVLPGMVVYVFPGARVKGGWKNPSKGRSSVVVEDIFSSSSDQIFFNEASSYSIVEIDGSRVHGGAARCTIELGKQYDHDNQVIQYTLLHREPIELGNIVVHKKDFAYRPVEASSSVLFDYGSSNDAVTTTTTTAPYELETLPSPTTKIQDPLNNHGDDNVDQQVSFRWWSWLSDFSQILYNKGGNKGGNTNDDYLETTPYQRIIYEEDGRGSFAGGSHGEIWRARRRCPIKVVEEDEKKTSDTDYGTNNSEETNTCHSSCDDGRDLIVKRLKIEHGYPILEAGLREVYFGELLAREVESSTLFTMYVDHFFRERVPLNVAELWIVYENAGTSLNKFLYTAVDTTGGYMVFQHSEFWRRLRWDVAGKQHEEHEESVALCRLNNNQPPRDSNQEKKTDSSSIRDTLGGRELLREVLRQLITAVAVLHERGIVHRDIKPSNIICKTTPANEDGFTPEAVESINCLLGDFSSAWDEFTSRNLYTNGPSSNEQTDEYAPPEVLFNTSWIPFFHDNPASYDSWSIGVVALELLLGTPNVFSVDQRTTALLTYRLQKEGASSHDIQRALYLAALSQFCIYVPTTESNGISYWPLRRGDPLFDVNFVKTKNKCTIKDFHSALRARDPLGIGFDDGANTLLHLVWRLLAWNPLERLSPSEALDHAYFAIAQDKHYDLNLFRAELPETVFTPGFQRALEHQTLDPRLDMSSDTATITEFICPLCRKVFSDHNSCQMHARSRKHAQFCTYDRSQLSPCLNAHSLLPTHPTSGYCDIQGRRKTIEDFHTIHFGPTFQFYGVFDGHLGNLASKYAASSFYMEFEEDVSNIDMLISNQTTQIDWHEKVAKQVIHSFEDLHIGIIDAVEMSPGGVMDQSGTTATILYVTELAVVIANVGDSRAVMSQWLGYENCAETVTAMQLTIDHIASSENERIQIIDRGGFVSESGGVDRVMGKLAVSRSLGDIQMAPFLSRIPHVLTMTKDEIYKQCGRNQFSNDTALPCFIILASDGLWDVMDNQEAVELAWLVIKGNKNGAAYQDAAEVLTHEAYVRGSSDNIGVCIVEI